MPSILGEDADGFIRTVEDLDHTSDWDEDISELEFGNDTDNQEEGKSVPFFQTERPAGWNLAEARAEAAAPRPYQTSIDEKIRAAQKQLPLNAPPTDTSDDLQEKKRKRSSRDFMKLAETEREEDEDADSDSSDDEQERPVKSRKTEKHVEGDKGISEPGKTADSKQKGKKKARKEKQSAKKTFADLHLSRPLLKAVEYLEWNSPTPVQTRAIPYILAGRDVCGSAVTGSGKTGAFVLPILERLLQAGVDNSTRVVILLPTRELAAQCHSVITSLAKFTAIRAALTVGGLSSKAQEVALRTRPHILVATPGRLIDHIRNAHSFSLDDVEVLIMDEADRLLDMGFRAEVEEVVRNTDAAGRQTLLFSATMNSGLRDLIKLSLKNPITLTVDPMFDVASTLVQQFVRLKPAFEANKDAVLLSLVTRTFKTRTIIFFRQKVSAHRFKILFGLTKLKAAELHGNLTQAQRLASLDSFREGTVDFLLCTDLAARGLDIAGVETVINYDMPMEVKEYVHRVGRTARAGSKGCACSIVCSGNNQERKVLKTVAKRAKGQLSARIVPPNVIGKWRAWIDSLDKTVRAVLKEERREMELRKAEMEINKVDNLIKHEQDIYARPARSWFQTENERLDEKANARKHLGLGPTQEEKLRVEEQKRKAFAAKKQKRRKEGSEREQGYAMQRAEKSKMKKNPRRR